ncbi:hypothetical protein [Aquimarina intermedia]|uniref:HTH cro/C1-type domain-containing protein n=1 Tax=Aquimarina intermedia TaxID=350814 RepID=A0A5S5CD32_9FLAO|nr:hypothetical protein [Aquimarina intermedia]TYP76236.1 hypothetical protein BD809_102454 [Aquimarina intermedia]
MKKQTEDAVRLNKVLEKLGITGNELSRELDYKSPSSVYQILEGHQNKKLSNKMINKIIARFPQISYKYLKKGEGDVLVEDSTNAILKAEIFGSTYKVPQNINLKNEDLSLITLKRILEENQKTNELLQHLLEKL